MTLSTEKKACNACKLSFGVIYVRNRARSVDQIRINLTRFQWLEDGPVFTSSFLKKIPVL